MKTARSREHDVVHEIEFFCLLASAERDRYKPLECEGCSAAAGYVRESIDGSRGAHFRARHLPGCASASQQESSETEGRVSWREGGRPAILDSDAPPVLWAPGHENDAGPQPSAQGDKRRASNPSTSGPERPPQRPSLATLLKYAKLGPGRRYRELRIRLSEEDEIDVAESLRHFDELAERDIGNRVVAYGQIAWLST